MKIKILAIMLSCAFVACNSEKKEANNNESLGGEVLTIDSVYYGADFALVDVKKPQVVIAELNPKDSVKTTLRGTVKEVCQAKGCWMTIDLGDEESMRVTFKDYGFFVPMDLSGKEVVMTGKLKFAETDVETLRHYAADAGKSKEEILAINTPQQSYNFVATGVKVVE